MGQNLSKEEKQLLQLCRDRNADISQFAALLSQDVNLTIYDKDGRHPLWWVSYHGRKDVVELFLQHNAEIDLPTDEYGNTALISASINGHIDVAELLLARGAVVNYQRKDGVTALLFASKNDHQEVVELLLENGALVNKGTQTPLYVSSLEGRLNVVKILLDHGADVNQPNDDAYHTTPLIAVCDEGHYGVAELLINKGTNINYQQKDGGTSLHWAADRGHIEVVKLLLMSHANLNIRTNYGDTPLHWAVGKGHIEVVQLLLMSHANLNIKNNDGWTPLKLAKKMKHKEMITLLKNGVLPDSAKMIESSSTSDDKTEGTIPSVEASVFVSGDDGEEEGSDGEKDGADRDSPVLDKPSLMSDVTAQAADIKCPVCLKIQVDPCTLQCGHALCQLCLADMWKRNKRFCPVCKETWRVFPAVSYSYRATIESSYSHQVTQLRTQYTPEDKELIKEFLEAKKSFSMKSQTLAQKFAFREGEGLYNAPPLTFSKDLNDEQLALWLSDHPLLAGTEYQHDIGKLKKAKIDGNKLLSLDKGLLDQFGLSDGFQLSLMKIIMDLKMHRQPLGTKIQPQLFKQKCPAIDITNATTVQHQPTSSISDQQTLLVKTDEVEGNAATEPKSAQPTESITTETEEIDTTQSISAQPTEHVMWKLPGAVQPQVDVSPQPLTFSKDMSNEQLALWLSNHHDLTGTDYHEDITKLKNANINGRGFLSLNVSLLQPFGLTLGFVLPLMNIIEDLKRSQQPPDSEGLPSQQQSPASSVATPTTQTQPTSSATRQQTKIDKVLTLKQLTLLKYTEKGEKKKLNIIEGAHHKWKDIASIICDDPNKLSTLEQQYQGKPQECLGQIFIDDFINKEPQDYSQDWSGLIELLEDVDLKALAERVKHALSCT